MIALLDNPIRPYDWGSHTAIAELLGRAAPGGPQAELWMGAHPDDPSRLPDGTTLAERIAADPAGELGAPTVAAFGPRLPFLAKVLAAERPLSLQVHPTLAQAQAGFAAEQAAGVARGAGNYADDNHKPELICALTPFSGLAGFRPVETTARLLQTLDLAEFADRLGDLAALVGEWLTMPDPGALVKRVAAAAAEDGEFPAERACASSLAAAYPGDPGVLVALLLNLVHLDPGEALFLPAGVPHAYLSGVGVEVMANSDNVLRGGLTSKRIDVPELLSLLDFAPARPQVQTGSAISAAEWAYPVPAREFRLSRISGATELPAGTPQIVLVLDGEFSISRDGKEFSLGRGQSVFVGAAGGAVDLGGAGTAYRVTTNLDAPGVP
jgi:mannose-6-phosphate isomerase